MIAPQIESRPPITAPASARKRELGHVERRQAAECGPEQRGGDARERAGGDPSEAVHLG